MLGNDRIDAREGERDTVDCATPGRARYAVSAGGSARVRVNLTAKGRSLVRRSKQVRVRVTVAPRGAAAVTRTVTVRR